MKGSGGAKPNEGQYNVRYQSIPVSYDTVLKVLDTDYENFAIIYSCSGVGPIGHTESIWVMARERVPSGPVLQQIYGVLDRLKISRSYFIETDQKDCETQGPPEEAIDPTTSAPTKAPPKKKVVKGSQKADTVEIIEIAEPIKEVIKPVEVVPVVEKVIVVKSVIPEPISHVSSGSKGSIREQIDEKIKAGIVPVVPAVRSTIVEKRVESVTVESETPAVRSNIAEKKVEPIAAVAIPVEKSVDVPAKVVAVKSAFEVPAEKNVVVPEVVVEEKVRELPVSVSHVAAIKSGLTRESIKTETTDVTADKTDRQIPVQIVS